jgi:hypothetical protein
LWKLLAPWKALLSLIAAFASVILAMNWAERSSTREVGTSHTYRPKTGEHFWKKFAMAAIVRPPTVRPDAAGLPEDAAVIGVVVDGKARAYALRSLRHLRQHVVNDLVGGVPITVAHCDVTGCTRVYASRQRSEPLDVTEAGFRDGEMILKIEGVSYQHSSGEPIEAGPAAPPLPYEGYPWIRTTWRKWKQEHPETDVYVDQIP